MQIIINWLNGQQNFLVGATLYKKLGNNQALKDLLAKGETPFAREQLVSELTKLATSPIIPQPSSLIPEQKETAEMPAADDEVLQAIKNEWLPLYQRMNLLRHNLDKYGPDNSPEAIEYRKPLAVEIKQLDKQCNAIWAKRDYYVKHGKLPFVAESELVIPTDPVEIAKLIGNIKKYIRRYRKEMHDNPGEPKFAQLYQKYKAQHLQVTGKEYEEKEAGNGSDKAE